MDTFAFFRKELQKLQAGHLLRRLNCVCSAQGPVVKIDGSEKIVFCSNDYLNLAADSAVIRAAGDTLSEYGFGAAASRLICGTMSPHTMLEKAMAEFFGKESALLFSSGFCANLSVLETLPQAGDIVLLDRLCHASLIDGAAAGKAAFRTYRRDDLRKLEKYLADTRYQRKFIVTESVFSMDGDTADLVRLAELKKKYNAILVLDEAHAAGCMGQNGAGLAQQLGLLDQIDILIAPLGKAFGASGAIVAAERVLIDYLINHARPFIYSTAPSPANCAAAQAALDIIKSQPHRRLRLAQNADYLRTKLHTLHLDTGNSTTHIIPVIIGSPQKTLDISNRLYEQGFLVVAIRPPTVPPGTARLRISLQYRHTEGQIDALADALARIICTPCRRS